MIDSLSFNPVSIFTDAQLERIHSYSMHVPALMSAEHQQPHQQQPHQQQSTSPALFLVKYNIAYGEYQEDQVDLDILDSKQIKPETNSSVPSWHELPQQSQILPLQQSVILHQPIIQLPAAPTPNQPNQVLQTDIASIALTAECLQAKGKADDSDQYITTAHVSQLLDTVTDCMSRSQLMKSSQLCSQILKDENHEMRQSLRLSHADYKPKSYYPNNTLKTYPCHTHLAKLIKNKGCMTKIPYLRVSNEHGKLIFGSVTIGIVDLREISISQGAIDLRGPLQKMYCTAILTMHSNKEPSEQDLEDMCIQINNRHQQYNPINIYTGNIQCYSDSLSSYTIQIPFSLNCGSKKRIHSTKSFK